MEETVKKVILPAFDKIQRYIVKLLCEYYEQKADKDHRKIAELCEQNLMLKIVNQKLKSQVSALKEENTNLVVKSKTASNMIRILSGEKDDVVNDGYLTPTEPNILKMERLLKEKLNYKNTNSGIFSFDFDTNEKLKFSPQMKKRTEPKKMNNEAKLANTRRDVKKVTNVLKPIQNRANDKNKSFLTPTNKVKDAPKPPASGKNLLAAEQKRRADTPVPNPLRKGSVNVKRSVVKKVSERAEQRNKENVVAVPKIKVSADKQKLPERRQTKIPIRSEFNTQAKIKALCSKVAKAKVNSVCNVNKMNETFELHPKVTNSKVNSNNMNETFTVDIRKRVRADP